jgi:hypothetical protein
MTSNVLRMHYSSLEVCARHCCGTTSRRRGCEQPMIRVWTILLLHLRTLTSLSSHPQVFLLHQQARVFGCGHQRLYLRCSHADRERRASLPAANVQEVLGRSLDHVVPCRSAQFRLAGMDRGAGEEVCAVKVRVLVADRVASDRLAGPELRSLLPSTCTCRAYTLLLLERRHHVWLRCSPPAMPHP